MNMSYKFGSNYDSGAFSFQYETMQRDILQGLTSNNNVVVSLNLSLVSFSRRKIPFFDIGRNMLKRGKNLDPDIFKHVTPFSYFFDDKFSKQWDSFHDDLEDIRRVNPFGDYEMLDDNNLSSDIAFSDTCVDPTDTFVYSNKYGFIASKDFRTVLIFEESDLSTDDNLENNKFGISLQDIIKIMSLMILVNCGVIHQRHLSVWIADKFGRNKKNYIVDIKHVTGKVLYVVFYSPIYEGYKKFRTMRSRPKIVSTT